MIAFIERVLSDETLLITLGLISLLFFVVSLMVIPWLILQIPADYFVKDKRQPIPGSLQHPVIRILLLILKNLAGVFFLLLGIVLLVLPGQGLLTILLGVILIDFPGKYRLERWFVSRKSILRSINWLRLKGKRPPIII